MNESLCIMTWNANGVQLHKHEIELLLKNNEVDVLLLSETHLIEGSRIYFKNYHCYQAHYPSGRARGGAAVIIKRNLRHHHLKPKIDPVIQAAFVAIKDAAGEKLTLGAVYLPPNEPVDGTTYRNLTTSLKGSWVLGGDWNAKHPSWGSRTVTPRGKALHSVLQESHCQFVVAAEHTHWPTDPSKRPDTLDFFALHELNNRYCNIEVCHEISGNHLPIILRVSDFPFEEITPPALTNKKTDWMAFRIWIERNIKLDLRMKQGHEIEDAVEDITKLIQKAARLATPYVKQRPNSFNFPAAILQKIKEKQTARKTWQRTRYPPHKTQLNRITRELRNDIAEYKEKLLSRYLEELSPGDPGKTSLWRTTKYLKKGGTAVLPIKNSSGEWARSETERAEVFAEHYHNSFLPNPTVDYQIEQMVDRDILVPPELDTPIKAVTIHEMQNVISNLGNRKAPGYDMITGEVIKNLPPKAIRLLTIIYNRILYTGWFPSQWKYAVIITILKPGKPPELASSYRPISLLPVLSKLLEKLILARIKPILDENEIIPDHQFGFRIRHSSIDQLHRVTSTIVSSLEHKEYCCAVFLDVQAAFDRVWLNGLLYKVKRCLPAYIYKLIVTYLKNRRLQVKVGNSTSVFKEIRAGVPQGSVLAPTLYSIYTADIPEPKGVMVGTFADDTAYLATHTDPEKATTILQSAITKLESWLDTWKIKVNPSKSVNVVYTLNKRTPPSIKFKGEQIPRSKVAKYLGVHLDAKLTWHVHIEKKVAELKVKRTKMYWLLNRNSSLSFENKLLLYKVILKPVWMYGAQIWGQARKSTVRKLQIFQNDVLRLITGAPLFTTVEQLHTYTDMLYVHEAIREAATAHAKRLESHDNPLAINLLDNSNTLRRLRRLHFYDLIY